MSKEEYLKIRKFIYPEKVVNSPLDESIKERHYFSVGEKALTEEDKSKIISHFSQNGIIILKNEFQQFTQEQLINYSEIFGTIMPQASKTGFVNIDEIKYIPGEVPLALTNQTQPMHTDTNGKMNFPSITSLYCVNNAKIGGESLLVDGFDVYKFLKQKEPEGLEKLFAPNAVTIFKGGQTFERPVFIKRPDNKLTFIYSPYAGKIKCADALTEKAYRMIFGFCHSLKNQLVLKLRKGDFLLIDNTRILHSRRGFKTDVENQYEDVRLLWRLWYRADLQPELQIDWYTNQFVVSIQLPLLAASNQKTKTCCCL
jgi:alpha-ketoglutarate-dependent taurine dioxygenase